MDMTLARFANSPRCLRPAFGRGSALPLLIGALALFVLGGCAREAVPIEEKVKRDPNTLLIYAACALAPMIEAARDAFAEANPGKSAELVYAEPGVIVERLRKGEVPDVVVCVGESEVALLESEMLLDRATRRSLGRIGMSLAVPSGNPAGIEDLADLTSSRVELVAISTPGLTALGTDGKRALELAGLWPQIQEKLFFRENPMTALRALIEGDADAALLYDPCLRLALGEGPDPDAVDLLPLVGRPAEVTARVTVGLHRRSPNALLAQRLLRALEAQQLSGAPRAPEAAEVPAAD